MHRCDRILHKAKSSHFCHSGTGDSGPGQVGYKLGFFSKWLQAGVFGRKLKISKSALSGMWPGLLSCLTLEALEPLAPALQCTEFWFEPCRPRCGCALNLLQYDLRESLDLSGPWFPHL
jgi:hypothetical protein